MNFYFTDRKFNLLGIASTDGNNSLIVYLEEDIQSIEEAARSFTGTIAFSKSKSEKVKNMAAVGNYMLFKDKLGRSIWQTIMSTEHDPVERTHDIIAEDAGIDLINETVDAYVADKAYNIAYYINKFTYDSGYEIGINEIPNLTRTLEWESEDSSALERILSVATQFDNAEIDFSFEVGGTQVVKRYINIYKKRGSDKRTTIYVNKDINKIITKEDIYDLATSIKATGGTPEGKNDPITLKGYKYTDPTGRFILGSDGVMRDTVSVQKWSRLLSNEEPNPQKSHIQKLKKYETTNQKTLCDNVIRELTKISEIAVNYEVDIAKLPDSVQVGDTIYLVDEEEKLYLSSRILKLTQVYSEEKYTAVLGDYLIQDSGIDQTLAELAEKIKNIPKGDTYFPSVAYADDESGTNFSIQYSGQKYAATIYQVNNPVQSDNPDDYVGKFVRIQGAQGAQGENGVTKYTWYAYADDVNGNGLSLDPDGKIYTAIAYNKDTDQMTTDKTDYDNFYYAGDKSAVDEMKTIVDGVPIIFAQSETPETPKNGDQWWQEDINNSQDIVGYFKYIDGAWVPQTIQQAVLNIKELNAININGSVINGSEFIAKYDYTDTSNNKFKGTLTIADAQITNAGTVNEGSATDAHNYKNVIDPLNVQGARYKGTANQNTLEGSYSLNSSGLALSEGTYSGVLSAKLLESITKVYTQGYTLPETTNYKNATIKYFRWGQVVNASFAFELKTDTGWVYYAPQVQGFIPVDYAAAGGVMASNSYRGVSCVVYYNTNGFRLIPTAGQGAGTFVGSVTYFTNDAFPK